MIFKRRKPLIFLLLFLLAGLAIGGFSFWRSTQIPPPERSSNYAIFQPQALTNYRDYFAGNYPQNLYQPVATWTGRLILPSLDQRDKKSVFFEVHNADAQHQNLRGKVVRLQWSEDKVLANYRQANTRDINFTATTFQSQKSGNIHPDRLNTWQQVDPLESLTGARPKDDLLVKIFPTQVVGDATLIIDSEPVQIVGSHYALVQIVARIDGTDKFRVRHFNSASKKFDGVAEEIFIPQVVGDRDRVLRSTNQDLAKSPLNTNGWYVYGVKNSQGLFTVQALQPRETLQIIPQATQVTTSEKTTYLDQLWKNPQKGTATSVLLANQPVTPWQVGDRAIVMHIFGGIGGEKAEAQSFGIVTGHFAYGIAEMIQEPIAKELRWQMTYYQVYAHNPDGIISGKIDWAEYMGNLERGWLGNRPVGDVLIRFPPVTTDYDFGGNKLSVMQEFTNQLQVMMARYRTGNGTGAALVTPATSCVQDSNQALYATIQKITNYVAQNSQIQTWLRQNPSDPQTQRFNQLISLGEILEQELVPLGIVRADWQQSLGEVAATRKDSTPLGDFFSGITTWRTLLPRPAFDRLSRIFLDRGADLWISRTNQVGGNDPDILPLAPTAPFS
jgi:predicted Abi (CAAX) family protease